MRYNRGSAESTLRAAVVVARQSGASQYVEPTAYGLTITRNPSGFTNHYLVHPDGRVFLRTREIGQDQWHDKQLR